MTINVGDAVLKMGVDTKPLDKDMKGLTGKIKKHGKAIALAMVAAGAVATAAATKMVKDWAAAGNEIHKMALRTGFATESLSELKHAAEISGASIDSLEKAAKRMSKTIIDASEGMATYIRAFDRIGLSVEELMRLSPEQQFNKIAMAIARLEDPTLRAATAQDIFGRAGTQLLPLLAEGADGIARLREEAHELGIVFDQEAANKAAKLTDELDRMKKSITGLQYAFAVEMAPTLIKVVEVIKDHIQGTAWLSAEYKANARVLEVTRKAAIEYMKALRGEDNQYKRLAQSQLEAIDNYLSLTTESNEYTASLVKQRAHLERYLIQMRAYEESVEKQSEFLAGRKEQIDANKLAQEAFLKTIQEEIDKTKELLELERRRAAARLERAGRLMEQIQTAGGMISPGRISAYYEMMGLEAKIQRYRAGLGERLERIGGGGLSEMGEVHVHVDVDGREVAEAVVGPLGDMTLQREEMEGK